MLEPSLTNYPEHLRTICEFALNRPIRPKVDRQSFDELKPGVDKAIALLDWFEQLQTQLVSLVDTLAKKSTQPAEELAQIVQAIDCCVVLENQFSGWSACVNRFSWFKRTFGMLRKEVADEVNVEQLNKDINRFQNLIGNAQYPIGFHMTGPLRAALKKANGASVVLMAALTQLTEEAATQKPKAEATQLRPLPFLLYLADGDTAPGSYNVFANGAELKPVMRVFKRYPAVDCSPPPDMDVPESPGINMELAVVLQRCPHFTASMASKWGGEGGGGKLMCCSVQ